MRSVAVVVGLLVALGAPAARAQSPPPMPNVGPALLLRLEGTLARTREAVHGKGFTRASLGFLDRESGERRFLGVERAQTVGGDHPLDGKDVLAALAPLDPNLLVAGPRELVDALRALPDGSTVRIEGLVDRGARIWMLREVQRPVER